MGPRGVVDALEPGWSIGSAIVPSSRGVTGVRSCRKLEAACQDTVPLADSLAHPAIPCGGSTESYEKALSRGRGQAGTCQCSEGQEPRLGGTETTSPPKARCQQLLPQRGLRPVLGLLLQWSVDRFRSCIWSEACRGRRAGTTSPPSEGLAHVRASVKA